MGDVGLAADFAPWAARRGTARHRIRTLAVPAAGVLCGAAVGLGSPPLIALALVPLAVALMLRADGAVVLFTVALYLNLPVVVGLQTGVPGALGPALAAVLLLPVFGYLVMARQPFVITPALALMVGYLVALVLSGTLAPGGGPVTTGPIVTFLTEGLLLYVLVTNGVRTTRTLRVVLWSVALAAGLMGLISLWQEVTHLYNNHLFGLARTDQAALDPTRLDVTSGVGGNGARPRLAGPIGEKNRYAQVLIVVLPLCVYLARTETRRTLRLLAAVAGVLTLCGMMLTFSRGAAIALGVVLLAAPLVGFVRARFVVGMLAAVVALTLVVAPDYISRIDTLGAADSALAADSTADGAVVGRATENLAALHVFARHPIFGVGPGQFFRQYSQEYANQLNLRFLNTPRRAHNLYLEIAADTGIVGLATFMAIVTATLWGLWRVNVLWRAHHPPHAQLAVACLLSLVAYLASGVFLQLAYHRYFFFLVALANAAIWVLRREAIRTGIA
jgi:putative inorganic carbon (hco3(-)) transporter